MLSVIQANGWFAPYNSFREFVEKKHGIHYRKAVYWTDIYNKLAEAKVPWDKVKYIGWTKLKEIAGVITTENVDEWVKVAKENNTISLIETVKAHLNSDKQVAIEDQTKKNVTTRSFKVHEDQKATIDTALAKAKEQSGTIGRYRGAGVHLPRLSRRPVAAAEAEGDWHRGRARGAREGVPERQHRGRDHRRRRLTSPDVRARGTRWAKAGIDCNRKFARPRLNSRP